MDTDFDQAFTLPTDMVNMPQDIVLGDLNHDNENILERCLLKNESKLIKQPET